MTPGCTLALPVVACLALVTTSCAREDAWAGYISDAHCGAFHVAADEHGPAETERECTLRCIRGGAAYVIVADGRVYRVANQDHPDLPMHAGQMVRITGHLQDGVVEISRPEAP